KECLEGPPAVLRNIRINEARTREAASRGYLNATELADYLVRKGMPFRAAHEVVGRAVVRAIERGCELQELSRADLRQFSQRIDEEIFAALSLESTLKMKSQLGGTAPEQVARALTV